MKKYQIHISPFAYNEILEAVLFVKRVNVDAAKELYKEIMESLYSLQEYPYRYVVEKEYTVAKEEERKILINKGRYMALYTVIDNDVYIDRFIDNRRNK